MTAEPSLYEVQVAATKIAAGYHHGYQHLHHLLMALVDQNDVVSRVLVDARLTRAALEEQVPSMPASFWGEAVEYEGASGPAMGIEYGTDAETAVARAKGIALGMGVVRPMARHLLFSCLWDDSGLMRKILGPIHLSRQELAERARSAGLEVPSVPLPKNPPSAGK